MTDRILRWIGYDCDRLPRPLRRYSRRLWRFCVVCRAYDDAGRELGFWE